MSSRRLTTYIPVIVAAVLGIYPAAYLVFGSLWSSDPGYPGHYTLDNYQAVASDPSLRAVLINTMAYAVGAALIAVSLGVLLSVAIQRTDTPFKKLTSYSLLLVLGLPWFVEDMGWNYLMQSRTGLYNVVFSEANSLLHSGVNPLGGTFVNINSLWGMMWVMGLGLTPLAYLVISPSLSLMDPTLEEASMVSGANLRKTFLRIDLPLASPAVLSAALLCLVLAIESFDVAEIIGVPGGVYVLASTVYRYVGGQLIPNDGLAAAYSLIMVVLTVVAIAMYARSVRVSQRYVTVGAGAGRRRVFALGRYRPLVALGLLAFVLVYPASVVGALLFASLQFPVWAPTAPTLTLNNYASFLQYPGMVPSAGNTAMVAASSAVSTLVLALGVAYSTTRQKGRLGRVAELASSLPLAFPTIVLGVGLLWALVRSPLPLYGTIWALTLAYTTRYVPVVTRFLSSPILQIGRELEEMSRICGATATRTIWRIIVPLLRPALLAALVYVLIVSAKDLGAAIMLSTGTSSVFAASLFNVYSEEPLIAVAGGFIFVISMSLVLLVVTAVFKIDLFSVFRAEARSSIRGASV
ncbi:MAG TPA: iron ABC transporter permease [Nitrososphaerales archaeon]|nr:iron ABC transporter permease [Nitrososphaerales archaeon]